MTEKAPREMQPAKTYIEENWALLKDKDFN